MLLHDAAGSIVVVSAESVKMAGEGCIVLLDDFLNDDD